MAEKIPYDKLLKLLETKKAGDHEWFLSLLDEEKQRAYEDEHIEGVMQMLKLVRIRPHKKAIKEAREEIQALEREDNNAENYRKIKDLLAIIATQEAKMQEYRHFFEEPYFARMDLIDNIEGYNSYYIGKKGDIRLEILDWRTPVARRYYQKSCSSFTFNEYEYKTRFFEDGSMCCRSCCFRGLHNRAACVADVDCQCFFLGGVAASWQ